ncbi:MAG: hypothetical protein LKI53_01205 [Bacteroidales bacterium]|jgi:hypothetical protein|nr:hypothetical protein [Bacteroidales bacterium]
MYKYWGYGLNIASEIEFPELLKYDFDVPDVEYTTGKVPNKIDGISVSFKKYSYIVNEKELLFNVYDVARYYAADGCKIIIEPSAAENNMRSIRIHVLATVMAAILLHRKMIAVHASAIKHDGKLILITGQSHAGKSTVLAELLKKGYPVFSDDIIVMHKDGTNAPILAAASYPMIKLWDDTIEKLNDPSFEDHSFRIQKDIDKYGFFFHDDFDKKQYPIKKIFILNVENIPHLISRILTGRNAFEALVKQVYRPMLIQSNKEQFLCFTLITDLVKHCDVIEIRRPAEYDTTGILADFMESLL